MRYDVRCKMYVRARVVRCTKYEDAGYDACDVVRAARAVRWAMYDGGGVLRARLRRDRATGRPGAGNRSRARITRPSKLGSLILLTPALCRTQSL